MKLSSPRTVVLALPGVTSATMLRRGAGAGQPTLAALLERGARARLVANSGATAADTWATIAAGVTSASHGIVADLEPWPGGMRRPGRQSWRAAPFWERLPEAGIATLGIGWPFTAPGAEWAGTQVDERVGHAFGATWDHWYLPPGVCPPALRDVVREQRVHPADVTGAMLAPFVPSLGEVDQYRDHRLTDLAVALARFSTGFSTLAALLTQQPWQFATLFCDFLDALDNFEGAPPPFDRVSDAAWVMVDSALGVLWRAAGEGGTLVVLSPGRAGEAGFVLALGPGLPAGTELAPFRTLDIAPSLFARFGLRDPAHAGSARLGTSPVPHTLPRWHPTPAPPKHDADDLARVRAFGFKPLAPPPQLAAHYLLLRGEAVLAANPEAAARLAERALGLVPDEPRAIGLLAVSQAMLGDFTRLGAFAAQIARVAPDHPWVPLLHAADHASRREVAEAVPHLRRAEALGGTLEWMRAAAVWLMLRRPAEARRVFRQILERQPDTIDALIGLGITSRTDPHAAERAFRQALRLDPANETARRELARLLRRMGRRREAELLDAEPA